VLSIALIGSATQPASATVRPPEEWFAESAANAELWKKVYPTLNKLEFGDRSEFLVPDDEIYNAVSSGYGADKMDEVRAPRADTRQFWQYDRNADGRLDYKDLLELGYSAPEGKKPSAALSFGTAKWIVLRTDFPDSTANYPTYDVDYFYDRFFADGTASLPSCNDYYQEVSFGKFEISGTTDDNGPNSGWYQTSKNRAYYKDWSRTGELINETIQAADPFVDFSEFDVDGDSYVDTFIIFYNEAEFVPGLWPHRSSGLNIHVDGVIIDAYFLTGYSSGNDSWTMTISCHEYGHILGLPDLYDIDYSSNGLGAWDLMAYQYDNAQKVPSPGAWGRAMLGWVTPTVIDDDYTGYSLPDIHVAGDVLKVWTNGKEGKEYFLVENRLKTGTDSTRPGEGVLIWHIDDSVGGGNTDNSNELHKHVDLESARGQDENGKDPLDRKNDLGSSQDPYFSGNGAAGYTNAFSASSNPTSRDYQLNDTSVVIENFSAIGNPATFDIRVLTPTRPVVSITSPGPGDTVSNGVTFSATATPSSGRTIAGVRFFANGRLVGEDLTSPYSINWVSQNTYNGSIEIRAVATDSEGEIGADKRNVTVSNSGFSIPYSDAITDAAKWAISNPTGDAYWRYYNGDAASPTHCMGIGPGYDFNENDFLCSVRLSLAGATHPILRFKHKYIITQGENFGSVFITNDDGATMKALASYNGSKASTWNSVYVDLVDYVGDEVYLLFHLNSNSLADGPGNGGWWIDDFSVKELSSPPSITGISPSPGSTLSGTRVIQVTASDDEGLDRAEYYLGDYLVFTDASVPFNFDWNTRWMFNGSNSINVKVFDSDGQMVEDTPSYTISNTVTAEPLFDDFESGIANWYVKNEGGLGFWHTVGNRAYTGSNSLFCGINTSGYGNGEADFAFSPSVSLAGLVNPRLMFASWVRTEPSYDFAYVYLYTDQNTSTLLATYDGLASDWTLRNLDLSAFTGDTEVKVGLRLSSDGGLTYQGWWVDYFGVLEAPAVTSCVPSNGRPVIGQNFTLNGRGFGALSEGNFVSVPTTSGTTTIPSANCVSWTPTAITFTVPANAAPGNITVFRHSLQTSWSSFTPLLPAPDITDISQY
jgi:immune inhibitor A